VPNGQLRTDLAGAFEHAHRQRVADAQQDDDRRDDLHDSDLPREQRTVLK
jgi:hypothetical protein